LHALVVFFFSSRRRHTRFSRDWSSDVCSSDLAGLNPNSLIQLLRRILEQAGVPADGYSSHSLRRGFATWAAASGWDMKALMEYVGWKDMKSALRYVDATASFGGLALGEQAEAV